MLRSSTDCAQCGGFRDVGEGDDCAIGMCSACGRTFALPAVPRGVNVGDALGGAGRTAAYGSAGAAGRTTGYGGQGDARPRGAPGGTAPYSAKSAAYAAGSSDPPAGSDPLSELRPGVRLELRSGVYEVVRVVSSAGQSREACVYELRGTDGSSALKVYVDPARGPNLETLERVARLDAPNVLRLLEHGRLRRGVPFERSVLALGGHLLGMAPAERGAKYTDAFVLEVVLPQLARGIEALNRAGVHHTDLKPENVLYLDRARTKLAICDYGSAKARVLDAQRSFHASSHVLATGLYAAPEVVFGLGSAPQSPYYALGKILLHLLYPDEFDHQQRRIREREHYGKPLVDYRSQHTRVRDLIEGLTLRDTTHRWGADEIARWMRGETVRVRAPSHGGGATIKLGSHTVREPADLVRYIESEPSWHAVLIGDQQGYGQLLAWVADVWDLPTKVHMEAAIADVRKDGSDYVKEILLRLCDPARPLAIGRERIALEPDPDGAGRAYLTALDRAHRIMSTDELRLHLFRLELALRAFPGSALRAEFARFGEPAELPRVHRKISPGVFVAIASEMLPGRGFVGENGENLATLEAVGLYFARHPDRFADPVHTIERKVFVLRHGRQELSNADYNAFLFAAFAGSASSELRLTSVEWGVVPEQCVVRYQIASSLTEFFAAQGIANNRVIARAEDLEIVEHVAAPITGSALSIGDEAATHVAARIGSQAARAGRLSRSSVDRFRNGLALQIAQRIETVREHRRAARNAMRRALVRDTAVCAAYMLPLVAAAVVFSVRYGYAYHPLIAKLGHGSYFSPDSAGEVVGGMWHAAIALLATFAPAAVLGNWLPETKDELRGALAGGIVVYCAIGPPVIFILAVLAYVVLVIPGKIFGFDGELLAEQLGEGLFVGCLCVLFLVAVVSYWRDTFHTGAEVERSYVAGAAIAAVATAVVVFTQVAW